MPNDRAEIGVIKDPHRGDWSAKRGDMAIYGGVDVVEGAREVFGAWRLVITKYTDLLWICIFWTTSTSNFDFSGNTTHLYVVQLNPDLIYMTPNIRLSIY